MNPPPPLASYGGSRVLLSGGTIHRENWFSGAYYTK